MGKNGYEKDYFNLLKEYYSINRISVANFDCKYTHVDKNRCSPSEYNRGSEAYIGENYGEHEHFKVLIASLDRGKGKEDLEGRLKEIEEVCIERKELNPHMKGTLDALKIIFSDVKVNEDVELFKHFAMINTAKCCVGDSMAQAPWKFFDNCKEYTKGEIDILQPDIIITQGRCAAEVFELLYPELKNKDEWYERKGEINIGDNHKALVICSVHPSARGKWKNIWQGFIKNRLPEIIKDRKRK